jgi:hypothetical protein
VFQYRVLRKIFGPKRDEVIGKWGWLHNELYALYSSIKYYSGDQIKKNEMGGACVVCMEDRCIHGRTLLQWIFKR